MAEILTIVQQAYESFLAGDIAALVSALDPAIQWSVPRTVPHGGDFHGHDDVLTFFQGLGAAWKPISLEIESIGEVGPSTVAAIVMVSGSIGGDDVGYGSVHVFTVKEGKITRFREFVDLDAALAG